MTSACECGKVRYLTRREARHEARSGFRSARLGKVRVYRCGGFWHLTSVSAGDTAFFRTRQEGATDGLL